MTVSVANSALGNSFGYLKDRVNELANAVGNVVVTVNSNAAVGNAFITGALRANNLYTDNLAGGNNTTGGVLTIISNVALNAQTLYVGNSTVNVSINSSAITVANVNGVYIIANVFSGNIANLNTSLSVGNSTINTAVNSTTVTATNANITNLTVTSGITFSGGSLTLGNSTFTSTVLSITSNTGAGVVSTTNTSYAVQGTSNASNGVAGISNSGIGVAGISNTGYGVSAVSTSSYGLHAVTSNASVGGVIGIAANNSYFGALGYLSTYAVYGQGDLLITGNLTFGNSTVNVTGNSTSLQVGNVSVNTTVFSIGNVVANTTTLTLGTMVANTTTLSIGNSSINISSNSTTLTLGNVVVNSTAVLVGSQVYTGGVNIIPKNRLTNPSMVFVTKYGSNAYNSNSVTISTNTASTGWNYIVDRWAAYTSVTLTGGNTCNLSRQTINSGGIAYCMRFQRPSGGKGTNTLNLIQSLESEPNIDLQNVAVTLSFKARCGANYSPTSNTLVASILTGTGIDQGANLFATATATGQATTGTGTFTLTGSFVTYVVNCTIPSSATQIAIQFVSGALIGTAGAADYFDITDVFLQPGTYAATQVQLDRRDYAEELRWCQRFREKNQSVDTYAGKPQAGAYQFWFQTGLSGATTLEGGSNVQFKVTKRNTPTLSVYSYENGTLGDATDFENSNADTPLSTTSGDAGFYYYMNGGVNSSGAMEYAFFWIADSEMF